MSTTDEPLCDVWIDHDGQARPLTERGRDVLAELEHHQHAPTQEDPMTDPYDNPQWRDYAKRVRTELLPKLKDSAATVSLVPAGETDVKFAVELGLSIMLDKPIVAVVPPGARVPAKLVAVADCIVEGDLDDPTMAARLNAALAEVLGR